MNKPPVLVSACLLGWRCRYDGEARATKLEMLELLGEPVLPVCPEVMGGLTVPRPACDLSGGDGRAVLEGKAKAIGREDSLDRTEAYLKGALRVAELARQFGVQRAILKSKSPSCGVSHCYCDGKLVDGMGICAAALSRLGIQLTEAE